MFKRQKDENRNGQEQHGLTEKYQERLQHYNRDLDKNV